MYYIEFRTFASQHGHMSVGIPSMDFFSSLSSLWCVPNTVLHHWIYLIWIIKNISLFDGRFHMLSPFIVIVCARLWGLRVYVCVLYEILLCGRYIRTHYIYSR